MTCGAIWLGGGSALVAGAEATLTLPGLDAALALAGMSAARTMAAEMIRATCFDTTRVPRVLALAFIAFALALPASSSAASGGGFFYPQPPPKSGRIAGFSVTERQALAIADRVPTIARERRAGPLRAEVAVVGRERWAISFSRGGRLRASVQIDGASGRVVSVASGRSLGWPEIYHGLHGPVARDTTIGMAILALLFVIPFARPPYGRMHLDLLALLSLGVSYAFSVGGHVYAATPLFYPPLLYLVGRACLLATRRKSPAWDSWIPTRALVAGLIAVLVGRYVFDVVDGYVSDIGYASLFGADSVKHGYDIYAAGTSGSNLDTYGPFAYLAYVPFSWIIPFGLVHAHAGAARLAAMSFDLLTVAGLVVLGRQIRDWRLGWLLGWGFAAFPFTFFALAANTNDALVSALLVWVLVAAATPMLRGFLLALAVTTKFAPAVLGGLFLRVRGERSRRSALLYLAALVTTVIVLIWAYLPNGGLREFWDATLGFQFTRSSPFSMWGLHPSWKPAHVVMEVIAAGLAVAAIVFPRRRDVVGIAAMGTTVIVAAQLTAIHWYYFYIPWFLPYALVALVSTSYAGSVRNSGRSSASAVATNRS